MFGGRRSRAPAPEEAHARGRPERAPGRIKPALIRPPTLDERAGAPNS